MRYEPIGDKILLRPIKTTKSQGGILLPADREQNFARGEVVAVGQGTPDQPMAIKPGQVVLYECKRGRADTYLAIDDYILVSQFQCVVVCIEDQSENLEMLN